MEMMAMVYMADLALKNRRWDEGFEPKPPGFLRRALGALITKISESRAARRRAGKKSTAEPCGHAVQS